jgi:hypothetical protein
MRLLVTLLLIGASAFAQNYTQRGFIESRSTVYPQGAANDRARIVGDSLFRYEGLYRASPAFQFAGAVDFRSDTHRQVERDFKLSWWDREIQRPLGEVRRLSATYHNGPVTLEVGKQFIRWGKTDIVTPTDRFAPRDFLTVVENDFIALGAARLNYEKGANTLEAVWAPRLTPSRMPLLNQRWAPESAGSIPPQSIHRHLPGGPQTGLRWNHAGKIEYEVSLYQGFNHLPSFTVTQQIIPVLVRDPSGLPLATSQTRQDIDQFYPNITVAGADIAVPTPLFTLKGESAYFRSSDRRHDEYALYVVQIERQAGEWFFVGGYAGEAVTQNRQAFIFSSNTAGLSFNSGFAPDRGLTKTFLGRAGYTIDANRSVAFEGAVRQNGDGLWTKGEYSQAFGQHWRATLNLTLIRGEMSDFLGQYGRNSNAILIVRYSF